ncbi:MAG: hypothetical protein IJ594_05035 [Oscillospiraceae bacterium]|nr:hypothetical protein [Oscillospiraceae bacterium]
MKAAYAAARVVRVMTVPPVMAAWLILTLWLGRDDIIRRACEGAAALLCLAALPVLAYPLSLVPRLRAGGRERQRDLAFLFSVLGYGLGWLWVCVSPCAQGLRFVFGTYAISVLVLLAFNKLLGLRASGHACSVAGPVATIIALMGGRWVPLCLALYALSFWASVRSGRHTVREYLLGSLSVLLAMGVSALIHLL